MTRRNPKTVHPFFEAVSRVEHGERAVSTQLPVGRRYHSAAHEGPHTNARNPGTRNRRTRRAYRGVLWLVESYQDGGTGSFFIEPTKRGSPPEGGRDQECHAEGNRGRSVHHAGSPRWKT